MASENDGDERYRVADNVQVQPRGLDFDTRVPLTGKIVDFSYYQESDKVAVVLDYPHNHLEFVHKLFVDTKTDE